jgi:antitoxin CptB
VPPPATEIDVEAGEGRERARLRWRCRRGMKELDLVLLRYLEQDYDAASPADRAAFARILDLQDPELFGYLVGRAEPSDETLCHVLARIRHDR